MSRVIRIATRNSSLALWQSNLVKSRLEKLGFMCALVPTESTGDVFSNIPIYEIGVYGVFTRQLDLALINNDADIAVHSLKDVPYKIPDNLHLVSVLERGYSEDVLLVKSNEFIQNSNSKITVASSSLRRKAQWLAKYPNHLVIPIRGNIETRIRKFESDNTIHGIILAKAGLDRLGILPQSAITLEWMVPAPAQGIIGIVCRKDDKEMMDACQKINHEFSFIAGYVERQFMRRFMGGCSIPISAKALVNEDIINFTGALHSYNGSKSFLVRREVAFHDWETAGLELAEDLLRQDGAQQLLNEIRLQSKNDENSIN